MMKSASSSTPTRPPMNSQLHPYDYSEDVLKSPSCHVSMDVSNIVTPQQPQKEKHSTKWCIDDFNIGRRLGEGSYSTVILVEEKKTGFLCALKVIKVYLISLFQIIEYLSSEIDYSTIPSRASINS
jgi:hypothetical protein